MTIPEYEIPVFGYKISELKSINDNFSNSNELTELSDFPYYLKQNDIHLCTYRGAENISLVRILNGIGFKFVGTYKTAQCNKDDFTEIVLNSDLEIYLAKDNDFEEVLNLEKEVMDFSTFQIDPLIDSEVASQRNVIRVKSYFNNPNHRLYVVRKGEDIIGFLQFVVDFEKGEANCVNGAIAKEYQGLFVGPKLYSYAFKSVFDLGIYKIFGGYSAQNKPVVKLFSACNFRIIGEEIHLRLYKQ